MHNLITQIPVLPKRKRLAQSDKYKNNTAPWKDFVYFF